MIGHKFTSKKLAYNTYSFNNKNNIMSLCNNLPNVK